MSLYMLNYEPKIKTKKQRNKINIPESNVACGHQAVQTNEVNWLCLDEAYDKLHRPNVYVVGSTYTLDVLDFKFTCKIEHAGNIILLHLFIINHSMECFLVEVACSTLLNFDKKKNIVFLENQLKKNCFAKCQKLSHNYLTTYSFTDVDMECLQNRKLYIAISLSSYIEGVSHNTIDNIKLNYDWGLLMSNSLQSDFTIISAEGTKHQVHKAILAAHSDVFKAMFGDETAESKNGFVELSDVSDEDLQLMLEFMYTGEVKDLLSCLTRVNLLPDSPSSSSINQEVDYIRFANLLILADRYNIQGLWELSQYIVSEQIQMFTVLEILVLADMYGSDFLKMRTMNFIKNNTSILESAAFKEIKNPSLIRELCLYLGS